MTAPGTTPGSFTGWWVKHNVVVFPLLSALAITGNIPTIMPGIFVAPTSATATLTGGEPTIRGGVFAAPASATATLTGGEPTVRGGIHAQPSAASLTITGHIPVLDYGIRPAGTTLTLTGHAPVIRLNVLFDAVGAGDTTATSITDGQRLSWSHTASGTGRIAIAALNIWYSGVLAPSSYTRTATYGGNTMTSLGTIQPNNTAGDGWIEFFYLLDPPTGAQTVQIDVVKSGEFWTSLGIAGNSLSYTGVNSIGTAVTGFGTEAGTSMSQTITSDIGHRVVAAFVQFDATAISGYSATSRFTTDGGANANDWVVGDAAGASPNVTVTATRVSSVDYAEFGFDLIN